MAEQEPAFLTEAEAKAYADEHGGTVEAVGVAFVVHPKEAGQDATEATDNGGSN